MITCWYCESCLEDGTAYCKFCGTAAPGSKPKWVAALDALPTPQDQSFSFGKVYVGWEIILVALGLLYWPWWAALGAVFIGLFAAVPATMMTVVLTQQMAQFWLATRARLLRPSQRKGLFALEEQTRNRLREDQEAFDALVGIITRERRYRDLMPEESVVEYRKRKVLPAFGQMVRLSASALLEMEVCQLLNQCEEVCDGTQDCAHQELNLRYERLEAMQRDLGTIKSRWSGYIRRYVAIPELSVTAEPATDGFEPQLPPETPLLAPGDLQRLQSADDTLRQLRHMLHQTQELRLLKAARPLARHEAGPPTEASPLTSMSTLFKQIQTTDRLNELEQEYQRIVAERRIIQDTPEYSRTLADARYADTLSPTLLKNAEAKNRIDAPEILSNSLPRH